MKQNRQDREVLRCADEKQRRRHHHGRERMCARGEMDLPTLLARCGRFAAHCSGGAVGQGSILRVLEGCETISQKELMEHLNIKAGSLSEVLGRMEHRGLIARERDEEDRRRTTISLTEAGREEAQRASEYAAEPKRDLFAGLTEEERQELARILSKLYETWHGQREEGTI